MPSYRAAWLLPISQPPIRDAWLRTERGRIVAFGPTRPGDFTAPDEIDLGNVAVLPGLVNAHTHLELSWMRGRIADTGAFPDWIRVGHDSGVRAPTPRVMRWRELCRRPSTRRARTERHSSAISRTRWRRRPRLPAGTWRRSCSTSCSAFSRPMRTRSSDTALDVLADDAGVETRAAHARAPCALFGISGAVRPHPAALKQDPFAPIERAPRRIGGRDRVPATMGRARTGLLEDIGKVGSVLGASRSAAQLSTSIEWGFSTTDCSSCTACTSAPAISSALPRRARRSSRALAATSARERARRPSASSSSRVCASPSAPTVLRACPISMCLPSSPRCGVWHRKSRRGSLLEAATINGARALGFEAEFGTDRLRETRCVDCRRARRPDLERRRAARVGHRRDRRSAGSASHERRALGTRPADRVCSSNMRAMPLSATIVISTQWKSLNFSAPPDFARAVAEYDAFLEILAQRRRRDCVLAARQQRHA